MSSWRSGRGLQWQPVKLWWTPWPRGLRQCWKIMVDTQNIDTLGPIWTFSLRGALTFVASGLDINGCELTYFEGTANLHCYTSCILTTLHCSFTEFLQCCHIKSHNKIFTKMWGVYSLLWDTVFVYVCMYVKWKWPDIRLSLVTHTRNLCSAVNPSIVYTHSSEHTHNVNTTRTVGSHLCCGTRGAVGGSVPCSREPQSWFWGWRERCTFTPPTIPAGPRLETATFGLWVRLSNHQAMTSPCVCVCVCILI